MSSGGGSSSPTRLVAGMVAPPSSLLCWIIQTARWCSRVAPLAASSSGSRKCESKLKLGAWWGAVEAKGRAGEGGAGHEEVGTWRGDGQPDDWRAFKGESGGRGSCKGPGGRGTLNTGSEGKRDTLDLDLDFWEVRFS